MFCLLLSEYTARSIRTTKSSVNGCQTKYPSCVEEGIAIPETIKDEISGGWLFSVKGLVAAEIFADFLEMAQYLLDQGYHTPAAVMAGSVLEEHLRQLCIKNGIDVETGSNGRTVPKRAGRMKDDLARKEVYNKLDQKAVDTWLDLRNSAAHGKDKEYSKEQVGLMLQGITEFLVRVGI